MPSETNIICCQCFATAVKNSVYCRFCLNDLAQFADLAEQLRQNRQRIQPGARRRKIAVYRTRQGDWIDFIKTIRRVPKRSSSNRCWIHYEGGWYPVLEISRSGMMIIAIKQDEYYSSHRVYGAYGRRYRFELMKDDGAFEPDPWGNVRYCIDNERP